MSKEKPDSGVNKKRGPQRSKTRRDAEAVGMSRAQMYRAIAVADVPEDEFERLVESDNPPTMTELVRNGRGQTQRSAEGRVTIPEDQWQPLADLCEADGVDPHDVVRGLVVDYLERTEGKGQR